jgi:glutamine synthetase
MVMAGLDGIRNQYPLSKPVEENIFNMSQNRQKKFHIKTLPQNLHSSLNKMKKSKLLKETLGNHLFQTFLQNKRYEIEEYNKSVTQEFDQQVSKYEIKKYLPIL